MNINPSFPPDPGVLGPGRWLIKDEAATLMLATLRAIFRMRLGAVLVLNLAQAEVYIALATVMRRFQVVDVVDKDLATSELFATMLTKGQSVVIQKAKD